MKSGTNLRHVSSGVAVGAILCVWKRLDASSVHRMSDIWRSGYMQRSYYRDKVRPEGMSSEERRGTGPIPNGPSGPHFSASALRQRNLGSGLCTVGNLWPGCICKRAQVPGPQTEHNNVLMVRYEEWFSSAVWLDGNEHDFPVTLVSPLSLNYLSFGLLFTSPLLSFLLLLPFPSSHPPRRIKSTGHLVLLHCGCPTLSVPANPIRHLGLTTPLCLVSFLPFLSLSVHHPILCPGSGPRKSNNNKK